MSGIEWLTTTPASIRLCPLEALTDPGARNFVLEISNRRFHGFVIRRGTKVYGYVDRCPHMGLPLAQTLDDYLTPAGDFISCSWHHASFLIEDGICIGGPCMGQRLMPWPVSVRDGIIETGEPPMSNRRVGSL